MSEAAQLLPGTLDLLILKAVSLGSLHGLVGVVVAMALLGLPGTWIPAQRALAVNALVLLREE